MDDYWTEGTDKEERELWMRASTKAFARIWDNQEDEIQSELLKSDPAAESAPDKGRKMTDLYLLAAGGGWILAQGNGP